MNQKIVILGAGESGLGAAMLAKKHGYAVWVSDGGQISEDRKKILQEIAVDFEEGGHSEEIVLSATIIIKSPGISPEVSLVQQALEKGISVIDELEFAYGFTKGKVIAITGTNGKTTTTLLIYHLLKSAGLRVGLAGNVGKSWAAQLAKGEDQDWWVLETSSFQIDGFINLKPTIAVLTNITPDHLDRYGYQLDNYIQSKLSLFNRMSAEDAIILYKDDVLTQRAMVGKKLRANVKSVSLQALSTSDAYVEGQAIHVLTQGGSWVIDIDKLPISGKHNQLNAMMAILVAQEVGLNEDEISKHLQTFTNAAHRMELVASIKGVRFINDSKGTNVDATSYALDSFKQGMIWIAGGVDKGNDYTVLYPIIAGKVKALICLGKDNSKLKQAFLSHIPIIEEVDNMHAAVQKSMELATEGDVVLLSPACASFDLFKNYEDRGNQFRSSVLELERGVSV